MAVALTTDVDGRFPAAARRVLVGAIPSAVAFAAAVLVLTVGALLAGPAVLRDHANGATLALLGMGVPAHWAALSGRVAGTVGITNYPALASASAVVLAATLLAGWIAARRYPDAAWHRVVGPSVAWFSAFCTIAAFAVSHGQPITISRVNVHVSMSVPLTLFVSATWALVGMTAGALLARRVHIGGQHTQSATLSPWFVRAPGATMVATAVAIMGLSACGTGADATTAASRSTTQETAAPSITTTTLAPTSTTAVTTAPTTNAPAARASTSRAARATTTAAAKTEHRRARVGRR